MLVGTGAAAGAAVLPGKWTKPVVDKIMIPAHAQTSNVTPTPEPTTTANTTTAPTTTPEPTTTCIIPNTSFTIPARSVACSDSSAENTYIYYIDGADPCNPALRTDHGGLLSPFEPGLKIDTERSTQGDPATMDGVHLNAWWFEPAGDTDNAGMNAYFVHPCGDLTAQTGNAGAFTGQMVARGSGRVYTVGGTITLNGSTIQLSEITLTPQ